MNSSVPLPLKSSVTTQSTCCCGIAALALVRSVPSIIAAESRYLMPLVAGAAGDQRLGRVVVDRRRLRRRSGTGTSLKALTDAGVGVVDPRQRRRSTSGRRRRRAGVGDGAASALGGGLPGAGRRRRRGSARRSALLGRAERTAPGSSAWPTPSAGRLCGWVAGRALGAVPAADGVRRRRRRCAGRRRPAAPAGGQATRRKRSWAWRLTVSTRSRRLSPGISTTMNGCPGWSPRPRRRPSR